MNRYYDEREREKARRSSDAMTERDTRIDEMRMESQTVLSQEGSSQRRSGDITAKSRERDREIGRQEK